MLTRLYELKLLETTKMDGWEATRVPGGWLFNYRRHDALAPVFVPYNNEFDTRAYEPDVHPPR